MKRILVQLLLVFLCASTVNAVSSLTIGWQDNASNEDGFTVERATSIAGSFSRITTVSANVTSYTDANLAEATGFCYRVNAFNTTGASPYTPVVCGITKATLNFIKAGTGAGQVTSAVAGINCTANCTAQLDGNSSVTLTATAAAGSVFAGWSGACTGTGSCTLTMNAAMTVTATFNTQAGQTFILTVAKAGTGSGTVTATGINCGSDCSETYNSGTAVTLTASATSGSTFTGWSGTGCSTGNVTLSANRTCTATFNTQTGQTFTLTVAKAGTGSGTVTATGINCGSDCSESFSGGAAVTLTATVLSGSTFTGWSGACSGTGSCTLTMNAQKSVTASFTSIAVLTNSLFVRQQYLDFLDREPEPAGLSAWVNALNGGLTRANLIEIFMDSGEFYSKGKFVAQTYMGILARDAEHAGFRGWLEALLQGMPREQIVQFFLDSGEFKAKFGSDLTNTEFVRKMYANVLLRPADTGGLNFFLGRLNSGQMTRAEVALGLLDSVEFQNLSVSQKRIDVSLLYFDMLRQDPDPTEFSAWVEALNPDVPFTTAINAFLMSSEYQAQF